MPAGLNLFALCRILSGLNLIDVKKLDKYINQFFVFFVFLPKVHREPCYKVGSLSLVEGLVLQPKAL